MNTPPRVRAAWSGTKEDDDILHSTDLVVRATTTLTDTAGGAA